MSVSHPLEISKLLSKLKGKHTPPGMSFVGGGMRSITPNKNLLFAVMKTCWLLLKQRLIMTSS